ncbi:MAG: hypothetical protein ACK4GW_07790 [Pseudorhodobacter sp.]
MMLDKIKGLDDWSALESELIARAPLGEWAVLPGKSDRPADATDPARRVRAGLIRFLLKGGDDTCSTHAKGVMLSGAWVSGDLDFQGEKTRLGLMLQQCRLTGPVVFKDAELREIDLLGSFAEETVVLERVEIKTDIRLSDGFEAARGVNLRGALIGKELDCEGGTFKPDGEGVALNCNALLTGASVFLREGFRTTGRVEFLRATIKGNLNINRASIDGVFRASSTMVENALIWRLVYGCRPVVNLRNARIGVLRDDKASWDGARRVFLDGLTYDRIDSDMTVEQRLALLARNEKGVWNNDTNDYDPPSARDGTFFQPHPYTQLARALAVSGDRLGVAKVREAREELSSKAKWARAKQERRNTPKLLLWLIFPAVFLYFKPAMRRGFEWTLWVMFGHGHRPARALWWVAATWFVAFVLYFITYKTGQMAPNSAVILTSDEWQAALAMGGNPLPHWLASETAKDYETFSASLYALDLFLPLDAIGQESAWAPSHHRGFWGCVGYWARLPIQLAGWFVVAVGAAVLTGHVGKSGE